MLNRVSLMGRLTADPEKRVTPSGVTVATSRLAVQRDYRNKGGEKETDFIPVVAWRQTAEHFCNYFKRGMMAAVAGRLQIRNWQDEKGEKHSVAEVVADSIYFGEAKKRADGAEESQLPEIEDEGFTQLTGDDGDLPF